MSWNTFLSPISSSVKKILPSTNTLVNGESFNLVVIRACDTVPYIRACDTVPYIRTLARNKIESIPANILQNSRYRTSSGRVRFSALQLTNIELNIRFYCSSLLFGNSARYIAHCSGIYCGTRTVCSELQRNSLEACVFDTLQTTELKMTE